MKFQTKAEEKAFKRGQNAARKGESRYSNPYHCATSRAAVTWNAWLRGFDTYVSAASLTKLRVS